LEGVYVIVTTPFDETGEVDRESLERHLEATVAAGVDGVTILGVAGEAAKLTDAERATVVNVTFATLGGRVPVVVGVTHESTRVVVERTRLARERGGVAVMLAPPPFSRAGGGLIKHFETVGREDMPIVLQDFPPANGVTMEPDFMAQLCERVPAVETIKLEDSPTALRIRQTLSLLSGDCTIVGGVGGLYFLDELQAGARGIMTGFPYPEVLVEIWRRFTTGDVQGAADVYYRYLPLNLMDSQPKVGLAARKEALKRRGQLRSAAVRAPGNELDSFAREHLHALIDRLEADQLGGVSATRA